MAPRALVILIFTSGIGLAEGALRYLRQGEQRAQQPVTVTEAGDHSMALSDGQRWFGLNTGVAIYPGHAGLWSPFEHQHRIRAEDIDLVAKQGVDKIFVGKGMNGDGVAQLEPDAKERLAELEKHGVHPYVSNTPTATAKFNDAVKASADGTVAGLFHTGC
mmetsp:Transcript_90777/g.236470  ORF Transcript_90777/g.236470 Transcript_90777/m.236470 type:complete len:161 (+) Transcript_90777:88-570(+)